MWPNTDKDGTPLQRDSEGNLVRPSGEKVGKENYLDSNRIDNSQGYEIGRRNSGGNIDWNKDKKDK